MGIKSLKIELNFRLSRSLNKPELLDGFWLLFLKQTLPRDQINGTNLAHANTLSKMQIKIIAILALKTQITTKVICFCRWLKCFRRSLSNKQCRLRSDCSYKSSQIRHCLSLYLTLLNNVSKNLQQTTKQAECSDEFFADVLTLKAPRKKCILKCRLLKIIA